MASQAVGTSAAGEDTPPPPAFPIAAAPAPMDGAGGGSNDQDGDQEVAAGNPDTTPPGSPVAGLESGPPSPLLHTPPAGAAASAAGSSTGSISSIGSSMALAEVLLPGMVGEAAAEDSDCTDSDDSGESEMPYLSLPPAAAAAGSTPHSPVAGAGGDEAGGQLASDQEAGDQEAGDQYAGDQDAGDQDADDQEVSDHEAAEAPPGAARATVGGLPSPAGRPPVIFQRPRWLLANDVWAMARQFRTLAAPPTPPTLTKLTTSTRSDPGALRVRHHPPSGMCDLWRPRRADGKVEYRQRMVARALSKPGLWDGLAEAAPPHQVAAGVAAATVVEAWVLVAEWGPPPAAAAGSGSPAGTVSGPPAGHPIRPDPPSRQQLPWLRHVSGNGKGVMYGLVAAEGVVGPRVDRHSVEYLGVTVASTPTPPPNAAAAAAAAAPGKRWATELVDISAWTAAVWRGAAAAADYASLVFEGVVTDGPGDPLLLGRSDANLWMAASDAAADGAVAAREAAVLVGAPIWAPPGEAGVTGEGWSTALYALPSPVVAFVALATYEPEEPGESQRAVAMEIPRVGDELGWGKDVRETPVHVVAWPARSLAKLEQWTATFERHIKLPQPPQVLQEVQQPESAQAAQQTEAGQAAQQPETQQPAQEDA